MSSAYHCIFAWRFLLELFFQICMKIFFESFLIFMYLYYKNNNKWHLILASLIMKNLYCITLLSSECTAVIKTKRILCFYYINTTAKRIIRSNSIKLFHETILLRYFRCIKIPISCKIRKGCLFIPEVLCKVVIRINIASA